MKNSVFKIAAVLSVASLVLMACGQKPNVHLTTGSAQVAGAGAGEFVIDPETGELISVGEAGGDASGGSSGTSGASDGTTGGGGAGGSGQAAAALPGDTDGITGDSILVGFHAPLTGAAAVPLTDIKNGVNLYRDWLRSKGVRIHGREINTIFRDDKYNPADAVRECRDMVEREKVFLLVGGAGTDQILACANYAARRGVPYLSAGVTENTVKRLNNYFAFSMSYPQQATPLAQMIWKFNPGPALGGPILVNRCPDDAAGQQTAVFCPNNGPKSSAKVAIVISDTDGFYDARSAFLQVYQQVSGKSVSGSFTITKFSMSSSQARDLVNRLKGDGIDVVYILTAPTNWLTILREAQLQRYAPRWVGVGLTKAINTVAQVGCTDSRNTMENSMFLNPWYAVDNPNSRQFAEQWGSDYRDHDIAFGLWGGSIVQHALFHRAGRELTRSGFINALTQMKNVKAPDNTKAGNILDVYSALNFSPNDHFGANQAHLLYANCSQRRWLDVPGKQFVSGF